MKKNGSKMNRKPTGADEFRARLAKAGFRIWVEGNRFDGNECNWIATRRALDARRCELNHDKPGVQIIIRPSEYHFREHHHIAAEIDLTGEFEGDCYTFKVRGLSPDDAIKKADSLQARLVAAWNGLSAEK